MSSSEMTTDAKRRRGWAPALYAPMKPLHNLYFAMSLLLVSILLPLLVPEVRAGTPFAGGAFGVLLYVAMQLRSQEADEG